MAFDQSTMTIDTQMSVNQNALVILVTGKLRVRNNEFDGPACDSITPTHAAANNPSTTTPFAFPSQLAGQENVLQFSQLFQLVATGPGAYYLNNDIFRLVYS